MNYEVYYNFSKRNGFNNVAEALKYYGNIWNLKRAVRNGDVVEREDNERLKNNNNNNNNNVVICELEELINSKRENLNKTYDLTDKKMVHLNNNYKNAYAVSFNGTNNVEDRLKRFEKLNDYIGSLEENEYVDLGDYYFINNGDMYNKKTLNKLKKNIQTIGYVYRNVYGKSLQIIKLLYYYFLNDENKTYNEIPKLTLIDYSKPLTLDNIKIDDNSQNI